MDDCRHLCNIYKYLKKLLKFEITSLFIGGGKFQKIWDHLNLSCELNFEFSDVICVLVYTVKLPKNTHLVSTKCFR